MLGAKAEASAIIISNSANQTEGDDKALIYFYFYHWPQVAVYTSVGNSVYPLTTTHKISASIDVNSQFTESPSK
jgi:hypothetical protein